MPSNSVHDRIALLIKAKRRETGLGVRKAAEKSGISAATLSRLERGITSSLPDAETLTKLAKWVGVSVSELLAEKNDVPTKMAAANTTPEVVEVYLRADKNLKPQTAHALAGMFKVLYEQATQGNAPRNRAP